MSACLVVITTVTDMYIYNIHVINSSFFQTTNFCLPVRAVATTNDPSRSPHKTPTKRFFFLFFSRILWAEDSNIVDELQIRADTHNSTGDFVFQDVSLSMRLLYLFKFFCLEMPACLYACTILMSSSLYASSI